jgi:hypothetical protein
MMMSTEKGSASGFSAVLGGTTVMGLKHPARRMVRIADRTRPGTKFPGTKFLRFVVFIQDSLSNFVLRGNKRHPVFPEGGRGCFSRKERESGEIKKHKYGGKGREAKLLYRCGGRGG